MLSSRARLATRRLVGVALLAMWLGQWSILAHAIGHARGSEAASHAVDGEHAHDAAWGHQAGTSACDLVDHLLTGQAPGSEPAAGLRLRPEASHIAAGAASNGPGPTATAYEARGPPRA